MAEEIVIMRNHLSGNSIILILCILMSVFGCSTPGPAVKTVNDPFPEKWFQSKDNSGWDSFDLPISNGNTSWWLGRVYKKMQGRLRPCELAWTARQTPPEDRSRFEEIDYSSTTFAQLVAHFPDLNVDANFEVGKDITFKVEFYDIKTIEMIGPVMLEKARERQADPLYQGPFIDSLLIAETIAMRVTDRVHGELGAEANIIKKLTVSPKVKWDNNLKAIRLAENAIIGYTLWTPTEVDLKRTMD